MFKFIRCLFYIICSEICNLKSILHWALVEGRQGIKKHLSRSFKDVTNPPASKRGMTLCTGGTILARLRECEHTFREWLLVWVVLPNESPSSGLQISAHCGIRTCLSLTVTVTWAFYSEVCTYGKNQKNSRDNPRKLLKLPIKIIYGFYV